MSEVSEQVLIDAPISTVWALVGDPSRYPDWLPRVLEVQGDRFEQGVDFVQISQQPLLGRSEGVWLIDHRDDLREIRMHCTATGMHARWALTEAQGGTFVNASFGMAPIRRGHRLFDAAVGPRFFRRWLSEALDGLKQTAGSA